MVRRLCLLGLVVLLAVLSTPGPAMAERMRLHRAVRSIPVATEHTEGYDRDLFKHWVDADGDCQDTREEVLIAESKVSISGCTVTSGEWFSYYDRETWTAPGDVDIDHVVALGEAWDSGAWDWTNETRELYANDLDDPRSLVAITDNVNASKGDRDPAEWRPEFGTCVFVRQWTAVKLRWGLRVDQDERAALIALADGCRNKPLTFVHAR